jgi:hypothetical protein
LNLKYTKKVDNDIELLIKEISLDNTKYEKTIKLSFKIKGHTFILGWDDNNEYSYPVSLQDIFNAMLHIILNGDPEIR